MSTHSHTRTPQDDLEWAQIRARHFESLLAFLSSDKLAWGRKMVAFWRGRVAHHQQRVNEAAAKGGAQ